MDRRRSRLLPLAIVLAILAVTTVLTSRWWLPAFGWALVREDGPVKAEIAVVLGGDFYGHRILRAGDLVRQGYVPIALISGPPAVYGLHECDLAIPFAVRHGYPAEYFLPFRANVLSTRDEARAILPILRDRNVHRMLLVTSDYHSARAMHTFESVARSLGGGIEIRSVTAPDEFFRPGSWWKSRQSQKVVFDEWTKTVAFDIGL